MSGRVRRRDRAQAEALDGWLQATVIAFRHRILPITAEIAQEWGRLNSRNPLPVADSLMAATARVHHLVVVTRNTTDYADTGVEVRNPFTAQTDLP